MSEGIATIRVISSYRVNMCIRVGSKSIIRMILHCCVFTEVIFGRLETGKILVENIIYYIIYYHTVFTIS